MATETTGGIWTRLRRLLFRAPFDKESDGRLLDAFLARDEGAAFAELVRRHGPMVMGVCRRALRDWHDAEDAFQATFLVLARRAASVAPRDAVGPWLYGVAYRTALKARAMAARRREKERRAAAMTPARVEPEEDWSELLPLLDRELSRLPEKYRAAVVLCELEGRPRKEAARKLGVPEGTLSSRLATAKRLLARRLARHGPAPSDGALAAALARGANVPSPLLASTAKAASGYAAGQAAAAVVSARVVALAEGVLKSMLLTKLAVAVLTVFAVVVTGAAAFACRPAAAPPAVASPVVAPAPDEKPPDKPAGPTARIVAPKEISADDPELKGELIVTNDGDAPVRVCTLTPGNDGLGGAFGQHFRPDWWKSDRPRWEDTVKAVVTLAPGKGVSFPFTILRAHYKGRDSFTITGFYAVEDKRFAEKLGLWVGKAEAEPVKVAVDREAEWGVAVDGVQARLRPSKTAWDDGENPEFTLDLRNRGKDAHDLCRSPAYCRILVDGKEYIQAVSAPVKYETTPLKPGDEVSGWLTLRADSWVPDKPGRLPGAGIDDKEERLKISAGKHTILAYLGFDVGDPPGVVPTQPVHVEVGKQSDWGEADGGIQARVRTPKAVWGAQEAPTFLVDLQNVGKDRPHSLHIPSDCEIEVDGQWYDYVGPVDVDSKDTVLEPGKQYTDWVTVTPDKLWQEKAPKDGKPRPLLPLAAGKHIIRVAYPIPIGREKLLRPISEPIQIEVRQEG